MADPQQQMTAQDFAQSVRAKYPGSYDHLSDADLTSKVVAKYPQYKSVIPNAGLADPAAPGPVANVAPTEGPLARTLTAGENRIADIHDQGVAQQKNEQHNFMTNGPIPSPIHLQNPINAIVNPEAQQRFSEGDVAGGLGETGANLAVLEAGRRMGGGEPLGTVENATAPIRGMAKAGNAVLRNPTVQKAAPYVGAAAGYGLGEIAGLPWYARVGLGSGGAAAGRAIKGGATLPGERFGLPPPEALPANKGGTVSRGTTMGARPSGPVPQSNVPYRGPLVNISPAPPPRSTLNTPLINEPVPQGKIPSQIVNISPTRTPASTLETPLSNSRVTGEGGTARTTRPEAVAPERTPVPLSEGGTISHGNSRNVAVPSGPVPPPVRTTPFGNTPEPIAETTAPRMSVQDQIGLAKSLGYRNVGEAMTKLGGSWDAMVNGLKPKPAVAEPPSVQPGSPTPFHSDAPLTPSDLMNSRMSTRIPTWDEVERQGAKERFYAQAPQVKTKNQLVNEVQPSMVAKSEANTSPYDRNLPTKTKANIPSNVTPEQYRGLKDKGYRNVDIETMSPNTAEGILAKKIRK